MKAIVASMFAACLLAGAVALAQNDTVENDVEEPSASEGKEPSASSEEKEPSASEGTSAEEKPAVKEPVSKQEPSKEVFKPSEEISEDLPVPFPIDI